MKKGGVFGPSGGFGQFAPKNQPQQMPRLPVPPTAAESPEPQMRSMYGTASQKPAVVDFGDLRSKDVVGYTPAEFLNGKPEVYEEGEWLECIRGFPELAIEEGSKSIADLMEEECKALRSTRQAPVDDNAGDRSMFGTSAQADKEQGAPLTPLVTTESGFRVRAQDELSELEQLSKVVTGILNKLTPEKYDTLSAQLVETPAITTDEEAITRTIELIFDRAVNQPSFSEMYAKLSHHISEKEKQMLKQLKKEDEKPVFRRLLVEAVQKEFEARKGNSEGSETAKARKLGNIQFVGELFKKEMLTERVIHHIIDVILNGGKTAPADFQPDIEDIEVLCRLLGTTGKDLETKARRPGSNFLDSFNRYFVRMEKLALAPTYPPRIKIALLNTIDLRKDGWPDKNPKAKKLKDLEKENEEKEKKKLEGARHANHTGDKTAWGQAANIHEALTAKSEKPKGKEKKKKDDDWDVVGGNKKAKGKAQEKGAKKGTQQTQQPSKGAFSALDTKSAAKDDKKKDKKKKDEKKEKKEKKDKKPEEEEEKKERPPTSVDDAFKIKVENRAMEAMQEPEEKRWELIEEDFASFKEDIEDHTLMVVHEVMRGISSKKEDEDRKMLTEYLRFICAFSDEDEEKKYIVKKSDFIRGVAWFLSSAAVLRYIDDYPAIYKRIVGALKSLIPAEENIHDINKAFQWALKSTKLWFEDMAEDEKPVDDVEELFAELTTNVWEPLHEGLSFEGEEDNSKAVFSILSLNHKLSWPSMTTDDFNDDGTPIMESMFKYMMQTLISKDAFDRDFLATYVENNISSSKAKSANSAKYIKELLE